MKDLCSRQFARVLISIVSHGQTADMAEVHALSMQTSVALNTSS